MTTNQISVLIGPELFDFTSFDNWCDTAREKFGAANVRGADTLCVDQRGRLCKCGAEFIRARDDDAYPVRVYRCVIE